MAYTLKEITLRLDNSELGMKNMNEVWADIVSGKIPLMFNSKGAFRPGISPISEYKNYESNQLGAYDLRIFTVQPDWFTKMDKLAHEGIYKKYDVSGDSIHEAAEKAWAQVWRDAQDNVMTRAFTSDFESTVPAEYTKDGKAHCYLYIALR